MSFQILPSDPSWLAKAASYIGFHEKPGNQGIGEFIDLAGVGSEGDPWCAIFANAMLRGSGYQGSGSALAKSFSRDSNFVKLDQPKRGAIAVFDRGGGQGHVGFWTEDGILGGNENDQVEVERISMPLVGYYWPAGDAMQPQTDFVSQVKAFQAVHGLDPDGEVGPLTWAALTGQAPTVSLSAGAAIYQKLLTKFQSSGVVGVVPSDGAPFGITTGSADQWARFGTAVCDAESGFDPRSANTSDPGGSFGIFQYAHSQVPGGDAYDIDASVSAFVRDAAASASNLRSGILGQRFSTIGLHPERAVAKLADAARFAAEVQQKGPVVTDTIPPVVGPSVQPDIGHLLKPVVDNLLQQAQPIIVQFLQQLGPTIVPLLCQLVLSVIFKTPIALPGLPGLALPQIPGLPALPGGLLAGLLTGGTLAPPVVPAASTGVNFGNVIEQVLAKVISDMVVKK